MNSAAINAINLLNNLGWTAPGDMTIEEIAWACGLIVTKKQMDGSEGRIIMSSDEAIISVNSAITYQPKINYIIAHEIGHARQHRGLKFFSDSDKTLNEWYAKGIHEKEANEFASELLMPSHLFIKKVKARKLDLGVIESASEYFGSSKTATFLRYKDLGDYPLMVIFIENGIIKWKQPSHDFPFTWLPKDSKLPALTVAGDYFYHNVKEEKPAKVDAIEWFPDDYKLKGNETQKLWEQCFPFSRNAILSCLWTF